MGRGVASDKARERSHTEEVRGKGPGAVTGGVRKDDRQNNFRNTFGKLFVWQPGGVRVCVGVVCRVVSKTTGQSWCMGGVDGGKWGGVVSGWGGRVGSLYGRCGFLWWQWMEFGRLDSLELRNGAVGGVPGGGIGDLGW